MLLLKREAPKLWVMTSALGEGNTRPDPEIEFESSEFRQRSLKGAGDTWLGHRAREGTIFCFRLRCTKSLRGFLAGVCAASA
jgi:hypothetical protein